MTNISSEEMFYDSISDSWGQVMNRLELQKRLDLIFNIFLKGEDLQNKSFLDIGAGLGFFSCQANKLGADVTAVEIGNNLIAQIKRRCKVKTIKADALNLPFSTNSFDYVLSTEVIEHTRDPQRAIRESIRVLKPKGILMLTTPSTYFKYIFKLLSFLKLRPYHGHENCLTLQEIKTELQSCKMRIKIEKGFNLILPIKQLNFIEDLISPATPIFINFGFKAVK